MNAQSNPAMTTFAGKLAKTDLKVAKLSTEVTLAEKSQSISGKQRNIPAPLTR